MIRTLLIHCDTLPDQGKSVLNMKNKNEATALHTSLQLGHMDIFDRLLEAGADSTIQVSQCIFLVGSLSAYTQGHIAHLALHGVST